MKNLELFYQNEGQRETVKAFLIEILKEIAVEKTFERNPVDGIADAKECIDKAFNRLEELYGKIDKEIINSPR